MRSDIPEAYQAVQSAHAAIEACRRNLVDDLTHPILVVATVENEAALLRASVELTNRGLRHAVFFEDDVGSYTALASESIASDSGLRKLFRKYKLLK